VTAPSDLPVMPPLKSAHSCRRCGRWLEGEWNSADDDQARADIQRQMSWGRCDDCTRREAGEAAEDAAVEDGAGTVPAQPGLRFASCSACLREMSGTRCGVATRFIDGLVYVRRPYRKPFADAGDTCNDCNAPVGAMHHRHCDQDRCPVSNCGSQAAFCEHQELGWPIAGTRRSTRRAAAT
jgi:hypothetical protein